MKKIGNLLKGLTGGPSNLLNNIMGNSSKELTPESIREVLDKLDTVINYFPPKIRGYLKNVIINERLTTDIAVPKGNGPHPIVYLIHGGGWVSGNPWVYRKLSKRFAQAGFLVFTIDYRLAPENPFPSGFNDCIEGYNWILDNCHHWNGNKEKIALVGDSAGANIAASVSITLKSNTLSPKAVVLAYGTYDMNLAYKNTDDSNVGKGTRMNISAYCQCNYSSLSTDYRLSPILLAKDLPNSHILVGSFDSLVDQSNLLADELDKYNIKYEYFIDAKMPHGYLQLEFLRHSKIAQKRIFNFLNRELNR